MRESFRAISELDPEAACHALLESGVATSLDPESVDGADDYQTVLQRVLAVAPRPLTIVAEMEDDDPRRATLRVGGKTVRGGLRDSKYIDQKFFALVNAALEAAGRDERVVEITCDTVDPHVVVVVDPDENRALDRVHAHAPSVHVAEIEPSLFQERACRQPAPREVLVRCVARRLGNTDDLAAAAAALDAWVARTRAELRAGHRVKISLFGNFVLRVRGRRRTVEFKASQMWKQALRGEDTSRYEQEPVRPEHAPPLGIRDAMTGDYDGVVVPSLGTFALERFEGYAGRNPRTGERVEVPAKTIPTFVPDRELAVSG